MTPAIERETDEDSRTIPRSLQVLIVEDSAPVAERLVEMVSVPLRVEVAATAASERDALVACEEWIFDLAIIDLQLAQGTGFEVIRRLRERSGPFTRIVVLTDHAVPAMRTAAYEAGADHFFDKSNGFSAVGRVAGDLLASRG